MRSPSQPANPQPSNPAMRSPSSAQPSQPQASNPTMQPPSNPQPGSPQPGVPVNPPSNPARPAQPRAPGTAGLRAPGSPLAETTFGVPPPPVRPPDYLRRPSVPPANKPIEQPTAQPRSSRTWIVIGALIAIAAGVAIALALV
jgi:hypothetical protein